MLTLEQSQKQFIITIYNVDNNNFTPCAIVCSDKEFDIEDVSHKIDLDTQCTKHGLPMLKSFDGIDIIDLDDEQYKNWLN